MHTTQMRAKVVKDNTGVVVDLPLLMTENGPLLPLVDYLLRHAHARSASWQQHVVQAVRLFIDYMAANRDCFADPKDLFNTFVQRLHTGTIGEDGADPSGLYWLPKEAALVRQHVTHVSGFSDWLAQKSGGMKPLNPWRKATAYEEMLNWAAYHHRHSKSFLGHIWDMGRASETAKRARDTLMRRSPIIEHEGVKHFPDSRFEDLLFNGFIVSGKQKSPRIEERLNLRDMLITILLHWGGLRMSEPFHLFVHDVLPDPYDPQSAMVRIFHPSEGLAPPDWLDAKGNPKKCTRAAYLRGRYQTIPRNEYPKTDGRHAGWKDPLLESRQKFMHVHWFPSWGGRVFKKLWDLYLVQRAALDCHHPYAFASRTGGVCMIHPYSVAHARAVRRIGMVAAKMNGATPHGHRHAYGQRMADAGINPRVRKAALHHKSLESQAVYTEPTVQKITAVLAAASDAMEHKARDFMHCIEEVK